MHQMAKSEFEKHFHVQRVSAKHGVNDDFAFLSEHAIFRPPPNKNPLPIVLKFCTVDYVGETTKHAKMVTIGWVGAAPHIAEI
jgi:hypothetical protein